MNLLSEPIKWFAMRSFTKLFRIEILFLLLCVSSYAQTTESQEQVELQTACSGLTHEEVSEFKTLLLLNIKLYEHIGSTLVDAKPTTSQSIHSKNNISPYIKKTLLSLTDLSAIEKIDLKTFSLYKNFNSLQDQESFRQYQTQCEELAENFPHHLDALRVDIHSIENRELRLKLKKMLLILEQPATRQLNFSAAANYEEAFCHGAKNSAERLNPIQKNKSQISIATKLISFKKNINEMRLLLFEQLKMNLKMVFLYSSLKDDPFNVQKLQWENLCLGLKKIRSDIFEEKTQPVRRTQKTINTQKF